ncbi:hypothetical protein KPL78_16375 [Roseomonas sp. HJA6]|uniref:Uncharacterized protein n=1 Tax=Roseomonas alba TaxID=2846776 RepID=A0ABS7ABH0_9PROT|nr:hypothetical protein [Neoroseomonas alba]MBW6399435.1 hypothetical protein [Neoroseomonas alba]
MTETPQPPLRRFLDPAALPLVVGGLVLVLAAAWLWVTPRPAPAPNPSAAAIAAMEARVSALEALQGRIRNLEALQTRIAALEGRPAPDLAPLERRMAALEARPAPDLSAIERQIAAIPAAPDLGPLEGRVEGLGGRVAAAESHAAQALARPIPDPAGFAPRAAVEGLTNRADRLSERLDAVAARQQAADAEAMRRTQELAGTVNDRLAAAERAEAERIAAASTALETRLRGTESGLATRLAALEQAQARVAAVEARATRLAAFDALRLRLDAGQPLGPALAALPSAPEALTRFASVAPPTESGLRLSFEAAARAARAASEPGQGQGLLDAATSRLSGLVTVRRGEQVVWGDAAAAELERARRALEAGDLDAAVTRLDRLPPAAKAAMADWIAQARALEAARAALTTLAAG